MLPQSSVDHYREQQKVTGVVLSAAQHIWGDRAPLDFDRWFGEHVDQLTGLLVAGQRRAAAGADEYVADTLAELGTPVDPDVEISPRPLFGVASDGRQLESLLYGAVISTKAAVARSSESGTVAAAQAWTGPGLDALLVRMQGQVADAERAATGLSIAARPRVGYVRMVNPPSCSRCAVLAGRFYRYNDGFRRHPQCDCRHIPSREDSADDLRTDPKLYFDSLPAAQQDKIFTIAGAQAIRDGADIYQVVNARRGMDIAGHRARPTNVYGQDLLITREGVTRHGVAGQAIRARGRNAATTPRLMPEAIYQIAESRDEALALLARNGYVTERRSARPSPAAMPTRRPREDAPRPKAASDGPTTPPIDPGNPMATAADEPDEPIYASDGTELPYLRGQRVPVTARRRVHILDGDKGKPTSGGHRYGTRRHLKTEFPKAWGDDRILEAVQTVLDNAGLERNILHDPDTGAFRIEHVVDRVLVRVVLAEKNGKPFVITAHPLDGDAVFRNYNGVQQARPFGWWDENEKRLAAERQRRRRG